MELNYAIAFLTSYNRWRRGDVSLNMPDPREIGIALDTVLAAVTEGGTGNSGVERPEPSPHFQRERDEARQQEQIHYDNLISVQEERDQWRECAEGLADAFRGVPYDPYTVGGFNAQKCKEALAEYRRLKEASK